MKAVTLYESTDGTRWPTAAQAQKRDALDAEVREIEALLPPIPQNSDVRVKVLDSRATEAKRLVVEICRRELPEFPVFHNEPSQIHPFSAAGRILDDVGGPLGRIWSWFRCSSGGYVYQQPFFALNPDKFEGAADVVA